MTFPGVIFLSVWSSFAVLSLLITLITATWKNDIISGLDPKASIDFSHTTSINNRNVSQVGHGVHSKTKLFDESITSNPLVRTLSSSYMPSVAWLMSFPNSGTSYTLRLVRRATLLSTATNNAQEQEHNGTLHKGVSVSFHPSQPDGPFMHKIEWPVPHDYILTKTHCAGYCSDCTPQSFLEVPKTFEKGCLLSRRRVMNDNGDLQYERCSYDVGLVKSAVHLLRNPFDNIVSRFHLQVNEHKKVKDEAWLTRYTRDKKGFLSWCDDMDAKYENEMEEYFSRVMGIVKEAGNIVCRDEFIKYVQWHNLATAAELNLDLPTHVVYYEDYHYKFQDTVDGLLSFLNMTVEGEMASFHLSDYSSYFTDEQRENTISMMKKITSAKSLEKLKRYYYPQEKSS